MNLVYIVGVCQPAGQMSGEVTSPAQFPVPLSHKSVDTNIVHSGHESPPGL